MLLGFPFTLGNYYYSAKRDYEAPLRDALRVQL